MQFSETLRHGQHYMEAWPMRSELAVVLPENQIMRATRFGQKIVPLLAIISVALPVGMNSPDMLPSGIATALFMFSLPVQSLYWLGKRSQSPLPSSLRGWYQEIHQTLSEKNKATQPCKSTPKFVDLAEILKQSFSTLDKSTQRNR
ncbi:terminus macrodomain insulation protein YfbV [Echinimonas agarilytica]|uniref:UPF0208 membrane protein YfbV n=1 Tax=Echinimonas agarilytica TaxID=1215918 RepID=A0AA41W7T5_9GAMM|nr:terminus macrodomain insulation protein YfbV [Echinimonas agarilytica]MCM2680862.1 DUF412 family protein [Echinimonas agarilytica]